MPVCGPLLMPEHKIFMKLLIMQQIDKMFQYNIIMKNKHLYEYQILKYMVSPSLNP